MGLALILLACGKTSSDERSEIAASGSAPIFTGAPISSGGAPSGSGAGASVGEGGAAHPVAGTRAGILAPLATDDATLDAASGAALLELAMSIGYAHGYALCTCMPALPFPEDLLPSCAQGESRFSSLLEQPGPRRCVLERSRDVPGFDAALRCRALYLRALGRNLALCPEGVRPGSGPEPVPTCPEEPAFLELLNGQGCASAFVCDDDRWFDDAHCDRKLDCDGGEDERGCGDVKCGDLLLERYDACSPTQCQAFEPPLCNTSETGLRAFCGDGQEVVIANLCDGVRDCATGRDEEYCY